MTWLDVCGARDGYDLIPVSHDWGFMTNILDSLCFTTLDGYDYLILKREAR